MPDHNAETDGLIHDWRDLVSLPVGSVVLARHKSYGDTWPWVKTDDTELVDEYGDGRRTAWACTAYTADRTDPDLLIESNAVRLIWRGDRDIQEAPERAFSPGTLTSHPVEATP